MTELYPLVSKGRLRGILGCGGDAVLLCRIDEGCRYFLWVSAEESVEVTDMIEGRGVKLPDGTILPVISWVRAAPYVHVRVCGDLRRYVSWVAKELRGSGITGKPVIVGVSGGKDSVAALTVVNSLASKFGLKVRATYVYIPFLDSVRSRRFVEDDLPSRVGSDVEVVEARKRDVKRYLKWRGMPKRGKRWCTYFKVRPMRDAMKADRRLLEVVADRVSESPKRARKLLKVASERLILAGRRFRPTYLLTILDVIDIVRSINATHPDYLSGYPRVACALCPYRSLYELGEEVLRDVDDAGLIEEVLRKEHSIRYAGLGISFEDFMTRHLWRFEPATAKLLNEVAGAVAKDEGRARLSRNCIKLIIKELWEGTLPSAYVLRNPWEYPDTLLKAWSEGWLVAELTRSGLRALVKAPPSLQASSARRA